ncbi:unnamed protein product [marine sediment metagenome]|uniref:Uncharacterized protein n=1 Tax=marine sediment metagenome TaxID=412755 RepID=X1CK83_9ZZZZ
MKTKEDLTKIAKNMLASHKRCLEYGLEFFKSAVKTQEGIDLTDEEVKTVVKLIMELPQGKHDMRYLAVK